MKVLMCIAGLPSGGGERQFINLAKGLIDKNNNVVIHVFAKRDSVHFKEVFDLNAKLVFSNIKSGQKFSAPFIILRDLHNIIREEKPSVIYGMLFIASCAIRLLSVLKIAGNAKIVSTIRTDYQKVYPLVFKVIERLLIKYSDAVVTNNKMSYNYFAKKNIPSLQVIENGIDVPEKFLRNYKDNYNANTLNILSVGQINLSWKKQDTLAKAISLVKKKMDINIKCNIYGAHKDKEKLEYLIKELDLEKIIFINSPTRNIIKEYRTADVLIHNSVVEGCPNVVLEAMANSLPVIVSKYVGALDIVENGLSGLVSIGDDEFSLAEKIYDFLSMDSKGVELLADNAYRAVFNNFSNERMVEKHLKLFERLNYE